jgi:general secretion pathway protein D
LVGRLFAHNSRQTQETDIILTLTPRIVRVLDLNAADLQPFRVGRDSGAPLIDIPLPSPVPIPPRPPGEVPEGVAQPPRSPLVPIQPPPTQPTQPVKPPPPPKGRS